MTNSIVSKIGVHCIGPRRDGFRPFLETINAAGRKLPLVKCRDDFGAAFEARQFWPDVITIGAFTDCDGFPFNFDRFADRARKNPHIQYWEVLNEINGEWQRQADLYLSLAPRFEAEGWRLCMFNCADGTPDYTNSAAHTAIAQAARALAPRGHILGLHGYGYNLTHNLLRYRRLHDYLASVGAAIPIAMTEYGPSEGSFVGDAPLISWCSDIDQHLMIDDYLIGTALWTLGGGGWQAVNWQSALPEMGAYIAAVKPIAPPPPAPTDYRITLTPPTGRPIVIDVPHGTTIDIDEVTP